MVFPQNKTDIQLVICPQIYSPTNLFTYEGNYWEVAIKQNKAIYKREGREGRKKNYTSFQNSDLGMNLGWGMHLAKNEVSPLSCHGLFFFFF